MINVNVLKIEIIGQSAAKHLNKVKVQRL
jgi:hypothetical protein